VTSTLFDRRGQIQKRNGWNVFLLLFVDFADVNASARRTRHYCSRRPRRSRFNSENISYYTYVRAAIRHDTAFSSFRVVRRMRISRTETTAFLEQRPTKLRRVTTPRVCIYDVPRIRVQHQTKIIRYYRHYNRGGPCIVSRTR